MTKTYAGLQIKWKANSHNMSAIIVYAEDFTNAIICKGLIMVRFISPGFKDTPNVIRHQSMTNYLHLHLENVCKEYEIVHECYTPEEVKYGKDRSTPTSIR